MQTTRQSAKKKTSTTLISISIPTALLTAIDREAKAEGLTRSAHMRRILKARRPVSKLKVDNE